MGKGLFNSCLPYCTGNFFLSLSYNGKDNKSNRIGVLGSLALWRADDDRNYDDVVAGDAHKGSSSSPFFSSGCTHSKVRPCRSLVPTRRFSVYVRVFAVRLYRRKKIKRWGTVVGVRKNERRVTLTRKHPRATSRKSRFFHAIRVGFAFLFFIFLGQT